MEWWKLHWILVGVLIFSIGVLVISYRIGKSGSVDKETLAAGSVILGKGNPALQISVGNIITGDES